MDGQCKGCRWWDRNVYAGVGAGECSMNYRPEALMAASCNMGDGPVRVPLWTHETFGCVQFAAREVSSPLPDAEPEGQ